MSDNHIFPHKPSIKVSPFTVKVPEADLKAFYDLLRLSKLGPRTYENTGANGRFGVTYDWMSKTRDHWQNTFDWRSVESRINSFPNFIAQIPDDDGSVHQIHFAGLFSQKAGATPLMFLHGWPGNFMEFLGILSLLRERYAPDELPYHVIVPSLPGYAFSSTPPVDRDWTLEDSARLLHKLMCGLGFEGGYVLQGGDIGSYTARIMCALYDSCKGSFNFCIVKHPDPAIHGNLPLEEFEKRGLETGDQFAKFGSAYALEHATRTATIGFTLSSSPLALLAWIGEKFLTWTDTTPSIDDILASATLYWLTDTFPRCLYPYRQEVVHAPVKWDDEAYAQVYNKGPDRYMNHANPEYYCRKPMGFSWFPKEIAPTPRSWAATTGNLVWFRNHDKGGHFAAMEQPETLLQDVDDFIKQVW
ncbi:hypothetical protein PV08_09518 [Exophiala spinifera]|uniref:Epoxide hydrolase N-terminal domain-containing protein n=1 Tax=Exophiala spinifera TaxID=91928 RepID=A0A0D1ZH22_9EURO|nr:uncharacterized protein PV08_09518 [Exophiala spinifera]KIW12242.1 hypothetical protein PV08_09518 [Exophiala spinifera]